jgi:high affinity Mn2+ porin
VEYKPTRCASGFAGQELTDSLRVFGRMGWNLGSKEAFQFAEADRALALGMDCGAKWWHHEPDRVGLAIAINGLAGAHRQYLELGGSSFLLGDNGLNYRREKIFEGYYNFRLHHGAFLALDLQYVRNPGFNASRGPVWIAGLRLHLEGDIHFDRK